MAVGMAKQVSVRKVLALKIWGEGIQYCDSETEEEGKRPCMVGVGNANCCGSKPHKRAVAFPLKKKLLVQLKERAKRLGRGSGVWIYAPH